MPVCMPQHHQHATACVSSTHAFSARQCRQTRVCERLTHAKAGGGSCNAQQSPCSNSHAPATPGLLDCMPCNMQAMMRAEAPAALLCATTAVTTTPTPTQRKKSDNAPRHVYGMPVRLLAGFALAAARRRASRHNNRMLLPSHDRRNLGSSPMQPHIGQQT